MGTPVSTPFVAVQNGYSQLAASLTHPADEAAPAYSWLRPSAAEQHAASPAAPRSPPPVRNGAPIHMHLLCAGLAAVHLAMHLLHASVTRLLCLAVLLHVTLFPNLQQVLCSSSAWHSLFQMFSLLASREGTCACRGLGQRSGR